MDGGRCVLAPTALPKEHGARIAAAAASMIRPAAVVLSADGGRAAAVVSCTPPSRAIKFLLLSNFLYTYWESQCCHATVVQLPYDDGTEIR